MFSRATPPLKGAKPDTCQCTATEAAKRKATPSPSRTWRRTLRHHPMCAASVTARHPSNMAARGNASGRNQVNAPRKTAKVASTDADNVRSSACERYSQAVSARTGKASSTFSIPSMLLNTLPGMRPVIPSQRHGQAVRGYQSFTSRHPMASIASQAK